MDAAYVRNAMTGALVAPGPVQFVRLPVSGEFAFAPPNTWSVVRVVHGWNASGPIAEIHVSPGAPHAAAFDSQISPF